MDALHAINELALSVIAGAYLLLFALQLVLWNRMEKMMQLIQRLEIEVIGKIPEIERRLERVEGDHKDLSQMVVKIQTNLHRTKIRDS